MSRLSRWMGCMALLMLMTAGSVYGQEGTPQESLQEWRELGFGLFIHWGPVAQTGHEISFSRGTKTPRKTYDALYKSFNPEQFDADRWAQLAKDAGMKYVVIVAKHHDGFCLWPSDHTDYDMASTPYENDVLGPLADACRERGLKFGVYYSVVDWYHPDYPYGQDPETDTTRMPDEKHRRSDYNLDNYISYLRNQMKELIERYDPFVLWFDHAQGLGPETGKPIIQYVRKLKPDILVNNRAYYPRRGWDFDTPERKVGRFNRQRPWETCMPIGKQWAWKPDDKIKSVTTSLRTLLYSVGGDGNLLYNVGPRPDGRIDPAQAKVLRQMGTWLDQYGEGVYDTRGGPFKPGDWGVSTYRNNHIYLYIMNWYGADDRTIRLPNIDRNITGISTPGSGTPAFSQGSGSIQIELSRKHQNSIATPIVLSIKGSASEVEPRDVPNALQNASLTYRQPVMASNVYENNHDDWGPQKAVDGNRNTRWATDRNQHSPWIEIDLGEPTEIGRVTIDEWKSSGNRVKKHKLQYITDGTWKTIYKGGRIGAGFERSFEPVTARRVRLKVVDATKGPSIRKIQLFGAGGSEK